MGPAPGLRLTSAADPQLQPWHLSVDGMSASGPNLSHWPGNRTPAAFRDDLSTGICLRFARADAETRAAFLDGADQVLNDHYDTDGFLSLLAVLRPDVALNREEICLAAAATGDFQRFVTRRGFAIDRIVVNLGRRSGAPMLGELDDLPAAERDYRRYAWLLAHAETVLDHPERFEALYADELAGMSAALETARAGGVRRRLLHAAGLAVLESEDDVPRLVLNTLAAAFRVLHCRRLGPALAFRYHDRTESWFDMVTMAAPPRQDLREAAARLQADEITAGPRTDGACWCADPPSEPVPELYFGIPAAQEYGQVSRELRPSRLPLERVVAELAPGRS